MVKTVETSKLQAVIFDLDGTLLDTLDDLTAATNYALSRFGYGAFDKDRVRRYVGNGVPKLIERALCYATTGCEPTESGGFSDRALFDACLAIFTEYYGEHSADLTAPYDGVTELISELKRRGIKTAIVTNKYEAAAKALKARFFAGIDAVVGAADDIRPKPAPDGVYKALGVLGVDKSRCVYVGDGETDMKTAKNCGISVVAVTWGFRDERVLRAFEPDRIIHKPSELLAALGLCESE